MEKNDLRIIKTKNALYAALFDLMKEKTFEEIKVSDICAKALINRSTFYAHFEDKYELLADCINNLKTTLTNELKSNKNISNTKEYYIEMIRLFLKHAEDKRENYLAIAINNRNSILFDIIYDVIDVDITSKLRKENNTMVPEEIIAKFYLGAVVNIGINWICNSNTNQYTREDIIKYLSVLIPDEL